MHRRAHCLFALYVLCALAALVWPVLSWVGAAEAPLTIGLPPVVAWHVLWIFIGFGALFLYDRAVHRGGDDA